MYTDILVPTDGSPGVDPAVEQALDLADVYGASVHALYVLDTAGLTGELSATGVVEELETAGREAVDELLERARAANVETGEGAVVRGPPHRKIVEFAADQDVDLIVMGTHGRTGLDRYLLGSVTEKVVRTASCPVLTVRAGDGP
jgi:nucleotide-binding universal stress UspA family protein